MSNEDLDLDDFPYRIEEFESLSPERQQILSTVMDYRGFSGNETNQEDLECALAVYCPDEDCLGRDDVGENLLADIHHKFHAAYRTAANLAAEVLRAEGYWKNETLDFWLVIDPAYDGDTRIAIVDWDPLGAVRAGPRRPFCYLLDGIKAWNFAFESLTDLVQEVEQIRDRLLRSVREIDYTFEADCFTKSKP